LLPISSHDCNELLKPDAGATRAAVITGAAATTGSAACVTTAADAGMPESPSATMDSGDCSSGSDPDSGAEEFRPGFAGGEVTAAERSGRLVASGMVTPECPTLFADDSFEPAFGAAVRLPDRRDDPADAPPPWESALADSPPDRAAPREGRAVDVCDGESALAPEEPAEPVVSARATGTDAIAEPTPSATANAPTRPT